jgi:kynurenine formamidase
VPANPQPVHTRLLIESGVYIMESLDLERLAADRGVRVPVRRPPLKIAGATGSMLDPLAVV